MGVDFGSGTRVYRESMFTFVRRIRSGPDHDAGWANSARSSLFRAREEELGESYEFDLHLLGRRLIEIRWIDRLAGRS